MVVMGTEVCAGPNLRGARHFREVPQQPEAGDIGAAGCAVPPEGRRRRTAGLLHRLQRAYRAQPCTCHAVSSPISDGAAVSISFHKRKAMWGRTVVGSVGLGAGILQ